MADLVRYFGTATGRVQGVGFRMFVQQNALELGITGWVKNMDDGTVTMEVQGTQEAIDRLEEVIRQGNYFIKVQSFGLEVRDVIAMERRFDIRY
ncbi:putative acylphosphatase [Selenomonas ruminantium subsp. lactilytica TAM6421]|uniref:acylphosphatase n=1 Tax=Selenomonas ruminantium subsp. lactilytica (strain NBRC 103574 / TAM6421) TaxID=927704 RepID=I0GR53_SELRL|nr:acylphosphatase [Selenomonas ruminantium]BAL83240.1 putative acylphosphatase [Selenomonas ruminantium subsp. lactilytica TAM6421]